MDEGRCREQKIGFPIKIELELGISNASADCGSRKKGNQLKLKMELFDTFRPVCSLISHFGALRADI